MSTPTDSEIFFTRFFREFRTGLRIEDQPIIDKLIENLAEISLSIPPTHGTYSFREILMLVALVNQRIITKNAN
jgi:hypothetical protein